MKGTNLKKDEGGRGYAGGPTNPRGEQREEKDKMMEGDEGEVDGRATGMARWKSEVEQRAVGKGYSQMEGWFSKCRDAGMEGSELRGCMSQEE